MDSQANGGDRVNTTADLDRLRKTARVVNGLAWAVVAGIMVYGVPIVYGYLSTHDIPKQTAWMLSLIADGALAVGMVATPILAQHGIKARWVESLRYVAGFATWALNTAGSWFKEDGPDPAGVLSHTWGPLLMFFAVEAAAQFQRKIADVIRKAEVEAAAADTTRKAEAERRAEEARRLRAEAEDATRKAAEVEALFRAEEAARQAAEERAGAEEADRKKAEEDAEETRKAFEVFRQAQAEERAEAERVFRAEIERVTAHTDETSDRFRAQLDEVKASARDARAQAAEASDAASRTAGQLDEARAAADRAVAEKVNVEQRLAALAESRQAVVDELARVRQAHDRLARKVEAQDRRAEEISDRRQPEISGAADRQSTRNGAGVSGPAARKSIAAVPGLLPEGVPAGTPVVPSVKPETVARVLAAYRLEPGATRGRTAEIAGVSAKTVQNVLTAVPADLLALPVGTSTEDDRAAV